MPDVVREPNNDVVIKFGGGVHSRASEDDIDVRECKSGENFRLDLRNMEFRNREPFDLVGTVPNNGEIRGFISLLKSDGTAHMAIQAADKVYEWDGASTFTEIGTVDPEAKLRGRLEHNFQLDDKVIITDINLKEPVSEWDGSTFQQTTFTNEQLSLPFDNKTGTFVIGETITDQVSGATAKIDDLNGNATPFKVIAVTGTFGDNNQFKGETSGATADVNNPSPTDTGTGLNTNSFGEFRAKYCYVSNERAVFANIWDSGSNTPHLIVGSRTSHFEQITVSNKPSSALAADDPFFLTQPDLRKVNGIIESFNKVVTSSEQGALFRLDGSDATDFAFTELFPRSGASGDESMVYAGNDIFYGRQGRIESVQATEEFGDTDANDLSVEIGDQLEGFDNWIATYNSRVNRVYFHPVGQSQIWTLYKPLLGSGLSPWIKYTTDHSSAFNPTAIMNCLDPSDKLEYVFFGDASGNIYRMEGTGSRDGGNTNITAFRESKLFSGPLDAKVYDIQGWVRWRLDVAHTLKLKFLYAGENVFNEEITVDLRAASGQKYYADGNHYSDGNYYGVPFQGRLTRKKFYAPAFANEFQVRAEVEGADDFQISEIGIRFSAAS